MAKKLVVDQSICTSCGLCAELAPNTFALDDDELSYVVNQEGDPPDVIEEAIESCPVECIHWEEE